MKRLQVFNTNPEYNSAKDIFKYPTVAHIKENLDTKFMNEEEYYSKQYLTFEALEDCVFTLRIATDSDYEDDNAGILDITSISYSIDNGNTWTTTIRNAEEETIITTPTINKCEKVLWKGIATKFFDDYEGNDSRFISTGKFKAYGNINSLCAEDNFINDNTCYIFGYLFENNSNLISAKNLILPANKLVKYCYDGMFCGCTSLLSTPRLNANILAPNCYSYMFKRCTSLINAPKLNTKILANYCYYQMFYGCTGLTTAPALPATTLVPYCYNGMFYGCTHLTSAPALNASTLANYCYYQMFYGCTGLTTAPALPATTLVPYCYSLMFKGCTGLTSAPSLPATKLATQCYDSMFYGCTSLTTAPILPATTLVPYCYKYMFCDCSKLQNNLILPATEISEGCYYYMFKGCTSLINAPILPATTLAPNCYQSMFNRCTSLTTAPELPATILATSCYQSMFEECILLDNPPILPAIILATKCYQHMFTYCTSLITAPTLPATTLADSCYYGMFSGCTSLTTAPTLPAISLVRNCYNYMFRNCSKINYINALFLTTPSSRYTDTWLSGVASGGTFIKNNEASWTNISPNGVPSMWTIETIESEFNDYFYTEALEDNCIFTLNIPSAISLTKIKNVSYSIDNCLTWITTNNINDQVVNINTPPINKNQRIYWKGEAKSYGSNTSNMSYCSNFSSSKKYKIGGDMSTLTIDTISASYTSTDYAFPNLFYNSSNLIEIEAKIVSVIGINGIYTHFSFVNMFKNCTSLVNASNSYIYTSGDYCCEYMFNECTSLKNAPNIILYNGLASYRFMFLNCYSLTNNIPILNYHSLNTESYRGMFKNCTSLTTAPKLPSTSIKQWCYYEMFYGCTSLTTPPELPATSLANGCYEYMFYGCTSLTTPPELPATSLVESCYQCMFFKCTSLVTAPQLPSTIMVPHCYQQMFQECTSLITAPALSATTLADSCYYGMFSGCTSLINPPKQIGTILAEYCCYSMFEGCTNLITSPELPAITLVPYCYCRMFVRCSNLKYVKALFTTTPSSSYTNYWLSSVSSNGIFIKNGSAAWTNTGEYAIPWSWTIMLDWDTTQTYSNYFKTTAIDTSVFTLSLSTLSSFEMQSIEYSIDNGNTWTKTINEGNSIDITTPSISAGNSVYWRGTGYRLATGDSNDTCSSFSSTGRYNVEGNIMSLLGGINKFAIQNGISDRYALCGIFSNSTNLINAQNLSLLVNDYNSALRYGCYKNMFKGCTSLISAPNLLSRYLGPYCYANMFEGCISLVNPPIFANEIGIVGEYCYSGMFKNCTSLATTPNVYTGYVTRYMFNEMFYGCTSLTTAPLLTASTTPEGCYNYMFYGCTNLNYISTSFANEPSTFFTNNWVYGVSATGTFRKNINAVWNTTGVNAIPQGWTISSATMVLWLDDFQDDDYWDGEMGITMAEAMQIAVDNPESTLANGYAYYGDTFEYEGNVYYLWESFFPGGSPYYILTTTNNYNTLNSQSINGGGTTATFSSLYAGLNEDKTMRYNENDGEWWLEENQLIRIDYVSSPIMGMWIDDYPDTGNGTCYGDSIHDLMDAAIASPAASAANQYVYYGDTMEYNGNTYYLWKTPGYDSGPKYLLTTTDNYNTLRNQSLEVSGYNAQFTALVVRMSLDKFYITDDDGSYDQKLIKVYTFS